MSALKASAPTRIDLAGGTLDIPPLDLLVPGALTVNAAIDVMATARVEPLASGFEIFAVDRRVARRFASRRELAADADLPLLSGLVDHFAGEGGLRLRTDCASPAGAGLGGSSSLAVAVAAALARFRDLTLGPDRLLTIARDVETRVIRVPTGVQDYLAALHGGVQAVHFGVGGPRIESLAVGPEILARRVVLVYTGEPRASGINNWAVTRAFLDGDREVRARLEGVAAAAARARAALGTGDWDALAVAVNAEWAERRRLAPGVSTPAIDALLDEARRAGAVAGKVCGAGGGGCVVLFVADGARPAVEAAVRALGMRVLEFQGVSSGVTVEAE